MRLFYKTNRSDGGDLSLQWLPAGMAERKSPLSLRSQNVCSTRPRGVILAVFLAAFVLIRPALGSSIYECAAACEAWIWGPSTTDAVTEVRQPETEGWYDGHFGRFLYEDWGIIVGPNVWHELFPYTGSETLSVTFYLGSGTYFDEKWWRNGVQFDWFDPGYENDPAHWHTVVTTPPTTVYVGSTLHAKYLFDCEDGITPPDVPDNFTYPPEPGSWILMGSGAVLLAMRRKQLLRTGSQFQ
jgi:hypothetical protein